MLNPQEPNLDWHETVYEYVRKIPSGKVMTYGQVADCVTQIKMTARMVGSAMSMVPMAVPWHRVVGAGGHLPIGKRSAELKLLQIRLLKAEKVEFRGVDSDLVDMNFSQLTVDNHQQQ